MTLHVVSREDFKPIQEILERNRRKTRPRKHDLYDVFHAVVHRLENNSAWRDLPSIFPPWRTVHEYHSQWTSCGQTVLIEAFELLKWNDMILRLQEAGMKVETTE